MLVKLLEYYKVEGAEWKARKISEYLSNLSEKRDWAGLTSRGFYEKEEDAVVDSLGILSVLDRTERENLIDIGSGGGIVGIVISIVCPEWDVVMAESSARKAAFLVEVIGSLELGNARVERDRAENLSSSMMFDAALGRAAGDLEKTARIALGLLNTGGLYVAIKGSSVEAEVGDAIEAIGASGGKLVGIEKPVYPEDFGIKDRVSLVVIRKI